MQALDRVQSNCKTDERAGGESKEFTPAETRLHEWAEKQSPERSRRNVRAVGALSLLMVLIAVLGLSLRIAKYGWFGLEESKPLFFGALLIVVSFIHMRRHLILVGLIRRLHKCSRTKPCEATLD